MNELIVIQPKQIGNEEVNAVDARDLHSQLGVKKDFSDWIKAQITRLNLVENVDYLVFPQKGEYKKPRYEYAVTLDAGKHIAMMAGTDNAYTIRQYFIDFEKAHKNALMPVVHDPKTQALIQALVKMDAIAQEQNRQAVMIEGVMGQIADLTPSHSMQTLNAIQGQISHCAKWYREISNRKNIPIKAAEAQAHILSMLLDHAGATDIGYIKDATSALQYLRKLASYYKGEFDKWVDQNSLFQKA